jgi:hypothetical protein
MRVLHQFVTRGPLPVAALAVAALLALAGTAHAVSARGTDGDPASDYLVTANVFLPTTAQSTSAEASLAQSVAGVYRRGDRLKVAVVADVTDLGAIPSLFDHPTEYAKFLGLELSLVHVGPLLVVMPNGFGVYDGGRPTLAENRVLRGIHVGGSDTKALTEAAAAAVAALTSADALCSPDVLAPHAFALPARAKRGARLDLSFHLADDSGRSSAQLALTRDGRSIALLQLPLGWVVWAERYSLAWQVPRSFTPGRLRYCVVATDPSGNRGRDCASVTIT